MTDHLLHLQVGAFLAKLHQHGDSWKPWPHSLIYQPDEDTHSTTWLCLITSPTGMLLMGMGFGCSVFEHKYFISEQLINQTSTVIIILCAGGRICPQVKSNPMIQQALFSYVTLAHETKSPWNKKWLLEISLGNSCFCAELHSLSHKLSSAYDIFCLHSSCRLDSA